MHILMSLEEPNGKDFIQEQKQQLLVTGLRTAAEIADETGTIDNGKIDSGLARDAADVVACEGAGDAANAAVSKKAGDAKFVVEASDERLSEAAHGFKVDEIISNAVLVLLQGQVVEEATQGGNEADNECSPTVKIYFNQIALPTTMSSIGCCPL